MNYNNKINSKNELTRRILNILLKSGAIEIKNIYNVFDNNSFFKCNLMKQSTQDNIKHQMKHIMNICKGKCKCKDPFKKLKEMLMADEISNIRTEDWLETSRDNADVVLRLRVSKNERNYNYKHNVAIEGNVVAWKDDIDLFNNIGRQHSSNELLYIKIKNHENMDVVCAKLKYAFSEYYNNPPKNKTKGKISRQSLIQLFIEQYNKILDLCDFLKPYIKNEIINNA